MKPYAEVSSRVAAQVLPLLAQRPREILKSVEPETWEKVEEIRLREGGALHLCWSGGEILLSPQGEPVERARAYRVNLEDINLTLQLISNCSLYAFEEELRRGYLTVPGGHRVGLSGKAVLDKGSIKVLRHISSLNFRVAREVKGIAEKVLPYLVSPREKKVFSTLVVSPPQAGKTTLLRDMTRCLSRGGIPPGFPGAKVGLVDERSEIAGCFEGSPQLDVGWRTDVLDGAPKGEGMLLLLRSMSPEVVVTDEIGREEDAVALEEMMHAGVSVLSSAHASRPEELYRRPCIKRLLERSVFGRLLVLSCRKGAGTVEYILEPSSGKYLFRGNARAGGG